MGKTAFYEISFRFSLFLYSSAGEPAPTPQPAARVVAVLRSHLSPTAPPSCLSRPFMPGNQGPCQPPLRSPSSASPPLLQEISVFAVLFYPKYQKKSTSAPCSPPQVEAGYAAAKHKGPQWSHLAFSPWAARFVGPSAIGDSHAAPATSSSCCPSGASSWLSFPCFGEGALER